MRRNALGSKDRNILKSAARVVGVDEVGRGCLAGPVVVCGVAFEQIPANPLIQDSKILTARQRERAAEWTVENCRDWLVLEVWPEVIDRINILEAVRLAMRAVVTVLAESGTVAVIDQVDLGPMECPVLAQPKADAVFFSVAAASVVAKVHRDRLMVDLSRNHPLWGWPTNKGYGTVRTPRKPLKSTAPVTSTARPSGGLLCYHEVALEGDGRGMAARRDKILKDAEKLVQKGKIDQAIKEYEKVLKQTPADANTINKVGDLYGRIGQVDRAIELYERIAEHFTQDGFTTKAIAILKKINRLDPQRLDIFDKLAELYIQQGLVVEAKNQYQILADWYSKAGDHERAVDTHRKLVQLDPGNHMAHLRLADLLIQKGEAELAIEVYDRLGRVLLERKKLDEAERLYRHALEQQPPQGEFAVPLCDALLESGRDATAREFLDAAFAISPNSYALQSLKVRTHLRFGEADEALDLANEVVQTRPEDPLARTLLGRALLQIDRHAEALETLAPAGEDLVKSGEFAAAQGVADELREVFPEDRRVLILTVRAYRHTADQEKLHELIMQLADSHFEAGEEDQAQRLYMDVLRADGSHDAARKRLAELQQVDPNKVTIAPDDSEDDVPEIVEVDAPEITEVAPAADGDFQPEERLNEAKVFAKYGLLDKAVAHLEEILDHLPDHMEARQSLIDLNLDRGASEAAHEAAIPLYKHYAEVDNKEALARLVSLIPALAGGAAQTTTDLEDEVIILDLDDEIGPLAEVVEAAADGVAEDAALVIDLDAVGVETHQEPEPDTIESAEPHVEPEEVAAAESDEPIPFQTDLDQLDLFIEQDLHQDAIRLLGQLESDYPGHPEVMDRRTQLKAKGVLLEEVVAVVSQGPEELFADEEESFIDLAKELEEELAEEEAMVEEATGQGKEEAILEEVFREFQKGVQEQLSEEDSDTHFNLGIAYKEMGLLPEAIREFQVSSRNPELFVECCSMIGVCFMEQGMWTQAAEWYEKALGAPNLAPEAELALRYDLASSFESAGELERAVDVYQEVVALNPGYRDVSSRLDQLAESG